MPSRLKIKGFRALQNSKIGYLTHTSGQPEIKSLPEELPGGDAGLLGVRHHDRTHGHGQILPGLRRFPPLPHVEMRVLRSTFSHIYGISFSKLIEMSSDLCKR